MSKHGDDIFPFVAVCFQAFKNSGKGWKRRALHASQSDIDTFMGKALRLILEQLTEKWYGRACVFADSTQCNYRFPVYFAGHIKAFTSTYDNRVFFGGSFNERLYGGFGGWTNRAQGNGGKNSVAGLPIFQYFDQGFREPFTAGLGSGNGPQCSSGFARLVRSKQLLQFGQSLCIFRRELQYCGSSFCSLPGVRIA